MFNETTLTSRPNDGLARARDLQRKLTAAAAAIGAIPVPGASLALHTLYMAEIQMIAKALGQHATPEALLAQALRLLSGSLLKRTFVEGSKLLAPLFGPAGPVFTSALGASTAALEAWLVAEMVIALCQNPSLTEEEAQQLRNQATQRFHATWH